MWHMTNDAEYLNRAVHYYGKGFKIRRDYYNGENYALCLNLSAHSEKDPEEKTYYKISAKKVRLDILDILSYLLSEDEQSKSVNKWPYATLASCYFGLGDTENGLKYETIFLILATADWEKETYFTSKATLDKLING